MIRRLIALSCCLLLVSAMWAQDTNNRKPADRGHWYIGLRGGVPFGVSSFLSSGADKTRAGLSAGIYGGYRFNRILSLEASAAWGKVGISADKGCYAYWLGADGNQYLAPVSNMQGWNYSDIYSSVVMQSYGVHLNVNILGFFASTRDSRWTLNLSPALYGVGSKATIKTIDGNHTAIERNNLWHLGLGGDIMAQYAITKNLTAGIYAGITHLTGSKIDGMPEHPHNDNITWEGGIRIGWSFGKRGKEITPVATVQTPTAPAQDNSPKEVVSEKPIVIEVQAPKEEAKPVIQESKAKTVISAEAVNKSEVTFPTVYFAFNSITVSADQTKKLKQILATLRKNPGMHIIVTGWCDKRGTVEANKRVSLMRAKAIKRYLTQNGIAASRIKAIGMGKDYDQTKAFKCRRAETTDKK